MQNKTMKRWLYYCLVLSIIIHFLFLLSLFITLPTQQQQHKKLPHLYVPSYVYNKPVPAFHRQQRQQHHATSSSSSQKNARTQVEKQFKQGIFISQKKSQMQSKEPASMLAASFEALKAEQFKSLQAKDDTKPILLVGDLSQAADPIIRLLAQSLSAHFGYPEREGMLGIKGRVIIEMLLHPDGHYSQIRMLKSSDNQNLDAAALYAVNTAPDVEGANRFLSEPTRFVVGFVFK